jgi:hypothetical protein
MQLTKRWAPATHGWTLTRLRLRRSSWVAPLLAYLLVLLLWALELFLLWHDLLPVRHGRWRP